MWGSALANGTETLGEPSIDIATGSGIVAAGTGLVDQPGFIVIDVPGDVSQAILYWEGRRSGTRPGDDTLLVEGNAVTGEIIGGPTFFAGTSYSSVYRADITDLGLVTGGPNSLMVEGFDVSRPHGAGLMIVYDDGSTVADIDLKDGVDIAYIRFPEPRLSTVAQDLTVESSMQDRMAALNLFFSSVSGSASGGGFRPSAINVTIDGVTEVYDNLLDSNDGEEWDTLTLDVVIPGGVDTVTVEPVSIDNLGIGGSPASMNWIAAALSVEIEKPATCHKRGKRRHHGKHRSGRRHGHGHHRGRHHGHPNSGCHESKPPKKHKKDRHCRIRSRHSHGHWHHTRHHWWGRR